MLKRCVARHTVQVRRTLKHILDRLAVWRNQSAASSGFDRHVADGEARLDGHRFERRAAELDDVASGPLGPDMPNDHEDKVFGGRAHWQHAVDLDAHVLGQPVDKRLRRQHMLDFRGADAEAQGAQRAIGGGVRVPANHDHARADHAVLRRHNMLDSLQGVLGVEERDVMLLAILAQVAGL